MKTTKVTNLKIHKLSQEQYDREVENGNVDENAMYFTPYEEVDLSGYAKKTDIPTDYAKSNHSHSEYAPKEHEHSEYLTEHQDLSNYAKKSDIPTVPTKISAFENDKGYLTTHQSLSGYYTKEEVNNLFNSIVNGNEVAY